MKWLGRTHSTSPTSTLLPLALFPSPILRVRCAPSPAPPDPSFIASLLSTVAAHAGLGLAAPQVHVPSRVFALRVPVAWTERESRRVSTALRRQVGARAPAFVACVNPEVLHASHETVLGVEACLSLPDTPALVRRAARVTARWTDGLDGTVVERELTGLPAVVFQHELDHLDGVLICDRDAPFTDGESLAAANQAFTLALSKYYAVLSHR